MIRLFCGFDAREAIGWQVFASSVLRHTRNIVQMTPLSSAGVREGSNAFTNSRFLVPYLCGYKGMAIFADASDMLLLHDLSELAYHFDPRFALQVVQHSYKTRHPIKYMGTDMQCPNRDYPRKNWASLFIANCAHPAWQAMTPAALRDMLTAGANPLTLSWLADDLIGTLPAAWNVLADEGQDTAGAKLLHWTAGIPCIPAYRSSPGADLWRAELDRLNTFGG
jgi:hypothetical protein